LNNFAVGLPGNRENRAGTLHLRVEARITRGGQEVEFGDGKGNHAVAQIESARGKNSPRRHAHKVGVIVKGGVPVWIPFSGPVGVEFENRDSKVVRPSSVARSFSTRAFALAFQLASTAPLPVALTLAMLFRGKAPMDVNSPAIKMSAPLNAIA